MWMSAVCESLSQDATKYLASLQFIVFTRLQTPHTLSARTPGRNQEGEVLAQDSLTQYSESSNKHNNDIDKKGQGSFNVSGGSSPCCLVMIACFLSKIVSTCPTTP